MYWLESEACPRFGSNRSGNDMNSARTRLSRAPSKAGLALSSDCVRMDAGWATGLPTATRSADCAAGRPSSMRKGDLDAETGWVPPTPAISFGNEGRFVAEDNATEGPELAGL